MNKPEYLKWLKERSADPAKWDHESCIAADRLIRQVTIAAFEKQLAAAAAPAAIKALALDMVKAHFGSIEVDKAMMELSCYPSWLNGE